ncbi:unnamed protein product [Vitrella brassicaformis CCMP3155]|uniref:Uncharacterized protein n=1 Tax=Vitrella brassicaformis (strain CCMP3155) TaxID=1169540 RepID=A0A0G4GUS7_VITBC|nr:unnamed protein product [Vitrella brassicaformis CCMP3155]|mmetsp:Transcript_38573/g.110319  ORF Transcript_38573/g.110319 Transcript_38573/m.110319 type:complete len:372 (+) Transcript_38573:103-1218(+)|eukprot:CEM34597.1 unnamed protein product [Vitrella brassicaformis CCMP3155]
MQFTAQQLSGGGRFSHRCRIGNWSEDEFLEEVRLKDFLKRKQEGRLYVTAKQQRLQRCLAATEPSFSPDGLLYFGSAVMIVNEETSAFMACDPYDDPSGASNKESNVYTVTTSPHNQPVARNTFIITRVDETDGYPGEVLHFGQHFRLQTHPSLTGWSLYLHSEPVSPLSASKFARKQEVLFTPNPSGNTKWKLVHPDMRVRFEMEGEPVAANSAVVIKHVASNTALASVRTAQENEFGREYEVHCHTYLSAQRTHSCMAELKGKVTGDIDTRPQDERNVWSLLMETPSPDMLSTQQQQPPPPHPVDQHTAELEAAPQTTTQPPPPEPQQPEAKPDEATAQQQQEGAGAAPAPPAEQFQSTGEVLAAHAAQ